jgi:hypothetical protein
MAWLETASETFVARHDEQDASEAARVLAQLEYARGQTRHLRPAIAMRLHDPPTPSFPPGRRDALLLGGIVFDLLAREEGEPACVELARAPLAPGALEHAFRGRPLRHTEQAWRSHLARLAHPTPAGLTARPGP